MTADQVQRCGRADAEIGLPRGRRRSGGWLVGCWAATVTLASFAMWAMSTTWDSPGAGAQLGAVSWAWLCCSLWVLFSWRLSAGGLLDPYAMFVVAAALFTGGHLLLEPFGLNADGVLHGHFGKSIVRDASLYSLTCLLALHAGGLSSLVVAARRPRRSPDRATISSRALRSVAFILIGVAGAPWLMQIATAAEVVRTSGYHALYGRQAAIGLAAAPRVLAGLMVPAVVFLVAGSEKQPRYVRISACLICTHVLSNLWLGYRAMALMPLLAYVYAYHRCVRPIRPTSTLIALGAVVVLVVPIVSAARNAKGGERLSARTWFSALASPRNPVVATVIEMGNSLDTVAYTMQRIPSVRDYDLGAGYAWALSTVLPNVTGGPHPADSHAYSAWITRSAEPWRARTGGGLGYSYAAEAYANFGLYGPVALALVGFLFAELLLWGRGERREAEVAAICAFSACFLVYARGESALIVRPLLWYAVGPYALAMALARRAVTRGRPAS